jgi:tetratricopeptide (TPR) repeat protein
MRLRVRLHAFSVVAAVAAGGAARAACAGLGAPLFIVNVFPVFVGVIALIYARTIVLRRAYRRLDRLIRRDDFQGALALLADLRTTVESTRAILWFRIQEAAIVSMQGRYAEALSRLDGVDVSTVHPLLMPLLLNNLAWSLALSGQPDAGVTRARQSIECLDKIAKAPSAAADLRVLQLGTLGTALVLAGNAAEGTELLTQALARGGKGWHQAARAFFLGEGLRTLGRDDDAAQAYRRAVEEAPEHEFGERARQALDRLRPYRSA